jgi:hypothetical protein
LYADEAAAIGFPAERDRRPVSMSAEALCPSTVTQIVETTRAILP